MRSYICSIGFAALLVTAPVVAVDKESAESDTANDQPAAVLRTPLPVRVVSSPDQTAHEAARETITDKHDAEDLIAQIRAANAAESEARTAVIQTVLAIAGTLLLAWTLFETRRTARAAIDAAHIARSTLQMTQRPFVNVKHFVPQRLRNSSTNAFESYSVSPRWINRGQTPTRDLMTKIGRVARADQLPDNCALEDKDYQVVLSSHLAPQAEQTSAAVHFSIDEIHKACMDELNLYVVGTAEYRDVFDGTELHVTRFCVQVHPQGDPVGEKPAHLSFSNLSFHNSAT